MSVQLNKYYQPDISEFHVGFECEANINNKMFIPLVMNGVGQDVIEYHRNDIYRVKYLDKEDIESLGFEFIEEDGDLVFKSIKTYRGLSTGDDGKIWILYYPKNQWTLIYKKSNRGEEDNLFYGIIKNKSELKKLLKQLNIL